MRPSPACLLETAGFGEVASYFAHNQQNYLFVVSSAGAFRGAVQLRAVESHLGAPELKDWAIARDLVDEGFPVVTPDTSLPELVGKFSSHRGERLAVIDEADGGRLVGSVSKTDVLLAVAHGVGPLG